MNLIKGKYGWGVRLFFLLLALVVIVAFGPDNWRRSITTNNVIIVTTAFALSLGWGFLERRRRRGKSN